MFEQVKEKLLQYSEYPEDKFSEETEIMKDLLIDSLNIMVIIGDFEEEYGISFDIEKLKDVVTVKDLVNVLNGLIENK